MDLRDDEASRPAHTVSNYCADHAGDVGGGSELTSLVHEFQTNSLTSLTDEMFSLYACVRWLPDSAFVELEAQALAGRCKRENRVLQQK